MMIVRKQIFIINLNRQITMSNEKYAEKKIQLIQILKKINKECDLGAVAVVTFEGREVAFFADKGTDHSIMSFFRQF